MDKKVTINDLIKHTKDPTLRTLLNKAQAKNRYLIKSGKSNMTLDIPTLKSFINQATPKEYRTLKKYLQGFTLREATKLVHTKQGDIPKYQYDQLQRLKRKQRYENKKLQQRSLQQTVTKNNQIYNFLGNELINKQTGINFNVSPDKAQQKIFKGFERFSQSDKNKKLKQFKQNYITILNINLYNNSILKSIISMINSMSDSKFYDVYLNNIEQLQVDFIYTAEESQLKASTIYSIIKNNL